MRDTWSVLLEGCSLLPNNQAVCGVRVITNFRNDQPGIGFVQCINAHQMFVHTLDQFIVNRITALHRP